MGRRYQVISGDGHLEIPADMWTDRVPANYREKAPKLVVHKDGSEWWHMDGWARENAGNIVGWNEYDAGWTRTYHNPDGSPRPGLGNASQRLREQDIDGVDAEVVYPAVYAGALLRKLVETDRDAYLAIIRAYNDYLAGEYCAVAPDRLIGVAVVPETGVDDAIAELARIRKNGLRAFALRQWPSGGDTYTPGDDRFFAAALDLDMLNAPHQSFGAVDPNIDPGSPMVKEALAWVPADGSGSVHVISQLILNGVFDRLPNLKIYFAETHGGWIAYYLNRADDWARRWSSYFDLKLKMLPSEYIRQHARFGFICDRATVKYRHKIGLDLIMWGSDFPHHSGTGPESRLFLDEIFSGVPENERRQILVQNPCAFFGLDPNKDLTPTPA